MYRRLSLRLLCLLLTLALPASAQFTRDNAANKKIDEAINEHYLATDFDKAEGVLTGTVQACGDKCSPQVIARAWMYVGIVRGSGKNDQAGAKEAFQKAIASDPQVKLDAALATPETQKTFDTSGGAGGSAGPSEPTPTEKAPASGGDEEGPGGMKCTPDAMEVQTRRPIPVECVSDQEAASVELRYKPFGGEWKTIRMTKKGDAFRGEIPCNDTKSAGDLKAYARAKDASGETIDNWGSKNKPVNYTMGESVTGEPPAFEGEKAPDRCADSSECPPDFPGCGAGVKHGNKDWGQACDNSTECKEGLQCGDGTCEAAPSCETNADCESGICSDNKCSVGDAGGAPHGKLKKNWLGLHFAQDIAIIGGTDVCSDDARKNQGFSCFPEGTDTEYQGQPFPGAGISSGTVIATRLLLVSFDHAFTPNITLGARVGFAFSGGPPANGNKFLPFHGELRVSYWFGKSPLAKKGLRPYVHLGGGIAQVDGRVKVTVADCEPIMNNNVYNACVKGDPSVKAATTGVPMDVWRKMGQEFITAGGGAMYAFTENIGAQLNLNLMIMLPTSGVVLQPSIGAVYGF